MYRRVDLHDKPTPKYDLYMGRANKWRSLEQSFWANPFAMKSEADRAGVLDSYKKYVLNRPDMIEKLPELFEKDLVLACWCKYWQTCHIDVLYELYKEHYK